MAENKKANHRPTNISINEKKKVVYSNFPLRVIQMKAAHREMEKPVAVKSKT